jgi:hypothetical protein
MADSHQGTIPATPPPKDGSAPAWGTLVVQTTPPAHEGWKAFSEVTVATTGILWAFLAILSITLFKGPLREILSALGKRIADPNSTFKLGPFELQRIAVLESKVASQAESSQVDRQVLTASAAALAKGYVDSDAMAQLRELAKLYQNVNISSWADRVRRKDDIAAQMASLVIDNQLSRESLARDPDEGIRMALATTITTEALPVDPQWIELAAPGIQLKHVRYRFMMAIARLVQLGYVSQAQAQDFSNLAEQYRLNADDSLLQRIDRTLILLRTVARSS